MDVLLLDDDDDDDEKSVLKSLCSAITN